MDNARVFNSDQLNTTWEIRKYKVGYFYSYEIILNSIHVRQNVFNMWKCHAILGLKQ